MAQFQVPLRRLPASATADEVAAVLRADGVVVIERLVPAETMDRVAAELTAAGGTFKGGIGSFAGHHTRRNAAKPLGESAAAQELAVEPLVLGAVEATLGPWCKKVCLGTCSAISVEPPPVNEPPAPSQVLHRDDSMWGCTSWPWLPSSPQEGRPTLSVSVMWAVSDFTEANGATRFLPGSHAWPTPLLRYGGGADLHKRTGGGAALPPGVEDGRDTVQAAMPKGSVVLWAGGTLHGASQRTDEGGGGDGGDDDGVRRGLLCIYNLGYLKPEHNFHWAMPAEVLKGFGPRLADLIGLSGENAIKHEWYSGPVYTQPYLGKPEGSVAGEGVQF